MKYRVFLFAETLVLCSTTTAFGFLLSSQLIINPSAIPLIQTIKQTINVEVEEANTTEYIHLVTPPSILDFNAKAYRFEKNTKNALNQRKVAVPRIQDVPFQSDLIPIPHKNLISRYNPTITTSIFQQTNNLTSPNYSRAMDKAKKFADRYLSKSEQLRLRQLADQSRQSGASDAKVRQVISRYLNSVLTPNEKRSIASQAQILKQEFNDSIFAPH
uniref:DUF148 domain-containing protein n=1 Tax=Syphacia muris TaxID=451379 RepID=A0A0N5AA52_9BILA